MARFICVFYNSSSKMHVSKINKKVKIIECDVSNQVEYTLKKEHGATYVKSIRRMTEIANYLYNKELQYIEIANNYKLEEVI